MYLILQQEVSNLFQVFHSVKVIKINNNPIRRVTVFNQIILLRITVNSPTDQLADANSPTYKIE